MVLEQLPETVQYCLCTTCLERGDPSLERGDSSLEPRMELTGDSWSCSCGKRVPRLSLENKIKSILQRVVETNKVGIVETSSPFLFNCYDSYISILHK